MGEEIEALKADNAAMVGLLRTLRSKPDLWKFPRAGGQDKYAGMPGFIRRLDAVLSNPHPGVALLEKLEQLEASNGNTGQ